MPELAPKRIPDEEPTQAIDGVPLDHVPPAVVSLRYTPELVQIVVTPRMGPIVANDENEISKLIKEQSIRFIGVYF